MGKRIIGFTLSAMLFTVSFPAEAQQNKNARRIGFLSGGSLTADADRYGAFREGLHDLGYVEGKNIVIEWRTYEGKRERLRGFAADLARLKVEVIVAVGSGDIRAAKEATGTIPIVMVSGGDPVASGFVASLARPGANITGLATLRPELSGKQLELLKETVPTLSRAAVFISSSMQDRSKVLRELDLAAESLHVKIQVLDIQTSKDFETSFRAAATERANAVVMLASGPVLRPNRKQVLALAVANHLPVIYRRAREVQAGGLMSYGVNELDRYRRAAVYVDKILKGAKAADLPVEQPMKFEFVINLKAAKQIGLIIPPNVLARADRVIR
jgi:ABC-type uncharacterized transport system substrate-binding protein